jgi:hypothetical protein
MRRLAALRPGRTTAIACAVAAVLGAFAGAHHPMEIAKSETSATHMASYRVTLSATTRDGQRASDRGRLDVTRAGIRIRP